MEALAVEQSIWIAAPRERVWKAVTDPEQIVQWFVPNLPGAQMSLDENGKVAIHTGPMAIDLVTQEEVEPPQKLTSRSLPDGLIATTYQLEEEQDGTRVTVRMIGFEALAEGSRQDRLNLSRAGWEKALENLKAFIGGGALPHPQAFVGPLFGYWREPQKKLAIERSIWIDATRERVWDAITDPEQIEQWFAPGTTFKASGAGVGSRLYVEDPETGAEMYVQVLEVVDPPHKLVTRQEAEPSEPAHVTGWTLTEENGGTRLILTYSGYEQEPDEAKWRNMEENAFGFGMMLGNIKAVIEGATLPQPQGF